MIPFLSLGYLMNKVSDERDFNGEVTNANSKPKFLLQLQ